MDFRNLASEEPLITKLKHRKCRWSGHTLKNKTDSGTRMAIEWNPQGLRNGGRLNNTWDDAKIVAINRIK